MLKEKNDDLVHIYNNQPPSIANIKTQLFPEQVPKRQKLFSCQYLYDEFFWEKLLKVLKEKLFQLILHPAPTTTYRTTKYL